MSLALHHHVSMVPTMDDVEVRETEKLLHQSLVHVECEARPVCYHGQCRPTEIIDSKSQEGVRAVSC